MGISQGIVCVRREIEVLERRLRRETGTKRKPPRYDKRSLDPYIFGRDYRMRPPRGWARRYRGRPRRGAGKGPAWNALKRGRKPKALNEAMRKFWAWVKEHEESIHRDQFLANDQGAFDARARRGRRQVLVQRASVKLSNPEVLAIGGDVSDDHFEGIL